MGSHPLVQRWLKDLSGSHADRSSDRSNYWNADVQTLLSPGNLHSFSLGTGESLYSSSILPAIEQAEQEIILVTCFWARSKTLDALNGTLRKLSAKGQRRGRSVRVRIYFSSSSLTQKLFHPQTLNGRDWSPDTWEPKLGLPSRDELPGLDLRVKSIFLLPFSVMHPKFVMIDRRRVILPSCNVSWEDWLEGCVELSGDVVKQFVTFWREFWADRDDSREELANDPPCSGEAIPLASGPNALASRRLNLTDVPAVFLPSPHHRNPRFAPLPWTSCPPAPSTPLNIFLLSAFKTAQKSIYIQTPNLTAPPILSALLAALRRGVDVEVVTSEKLMVLEQIVTAGTTTARCVRKLVKLYKRRAARKGQVSSVDSPALMESGNARLGNLRISYYTPLGSPEQPRKKSSSGFTAAEPVQSHLKLTIIDSEWTVLGSGNLDRASIFTSQELGVAFHSREFAATVRGSVDECMRERKKLFYESSARG